jgi:hypothetical protein
VTSPRPGCGTTTATLLTAPSVHGFTVDQQGRIVGDATPPVPRSSLAPKRPDVVIERCLRPGQVIPEHGREMTA